MTRLRTFLIEDSSLIRANLIETLIENTEVDVVDCAEGEAAAKAWLAANDGACDLVIVDIFLKQGTGIGVLQAMARRSDAPRRMVLSNHATSEVRAKCLELGAEAVFDKSNELEEMLVWLNHQPHSGHATPALLS